MKRKFLIFVFCLGACVANAQTKWEYPKRPSPEEMRFTTYDEQVKKSQPPKELLNSWDTETLFKYCVNYPFNGVTLLFNNFNDGFKRAYEQATVWHEFIRRKDAIKVFVQHFETHSYKRLIEIRDDEIRRKELFNLYFLEKLVSETDFTLYLDTSERRKLVNTILQSHQSKKDYPNELFGFPYNSSLSALLKILESDQEISPDDDVSLVKFREKTGNESFVDDIMESAIISKAVNYIK